MSTYYLDCEFNGLGGALISMALVRDDGASGYWVLPPMPREDADPWVHDNVMSVLFETPAWIAQTTNLAADIGAFLAGDPDPLIIADWPDDIHYFCKAAITGPGTMIDVPRLRFEVRRVDAYPTTLPGAVQHNAWWDAMALRHLLQGAKPAPDAAPGMS